MSEDVLIMRQDGFVEIRLNRPSKKNALTDAMYGAIADAIEAAERDAGIGAILLSAEGDIFCAGNDLGDFAAVASGTAGETQRNVHRFLRALATAAKPVVAAVGGDGVGVGVTMLLHCDIVVIAEDARLVTPFTSLGLTPEAGSSLLLPASIGYKRAYMMLALGQPMTGTEAARCGLATTALAARAEVDGLARKLARDCSARPVEGMRITKKLMRDTGAILARIDEETGYFRERLQSPEARAAFEAFFKR